MNNNYDLVYPSQEDHYNIDIINNNFSKLADSIDIARSGYFKGSTIVAAHDSKSPLRACADLVCSAGDCSEILGQALDKTPAGGEILLLDGNFYLKNYFEIDKAVTVRGAGSRYTSITKHRDMPASANMLLKVSAENVTLKDMGIHNIVDDTDVHCICLYRPNQVIDSCCFTLGDSRVGNSMTGIYMSNRGGYVRVSNCIFKKYDSSVNDIYIDDVWHGAIYGNACENIESGEPMPVRINLYSGETWQNMGFGAQYAAVYVNNVLKN